MGISAASHCGHPGWMPLFHNVIFGSEKVAPFIA
jgi:hypothetical protein